MSTSPATACLASPLTCSGTIQPTRLSAAYRIGLVVVTIAMLLLPLLYLGLIVATGAAVWWHVTENVTILSNGASAKWRLLAYVTPAIVGLVLMFFMVKPILARPARRAEPLSIDPADQPALFALIEEICRQVRAPLPRRVQVDCAVNASAGFMPGRLSLIRNDLVLTIGLPLVAGLSVRELGGVLAHEFGHFAQGGGMRLTAIVRGVNAWFARVVYERDQWDESLEYWSKEADWRLAAVLMIARAAVWVSRTILSALMLGAHAISCFMMRQMEYDADSYEVKFAGSDAFVRTSTRLRDLHEAATLAYAALHDTVRTGSAPASLPTFMVKRSSPATDEPSIDAEQQKTGVFDTHPSDADRIRAARAAAAAGVVVGGGEPAHLLFRDFESISAAATRHHYEHDLGLSVQALTFVDAEAAIQESRNRAEDILSIARFFNLIRSRYRPIGLPMGELRLLTAGELSAQWASARERMERAKGEIAHQYREFDGLEVQRQKVFVAQELVAAGFHDVTPADFGLEIAPGDDAASVDARVLEQQRELIPALEAFEAAAGQRLCCALLMTGGEADQEVLGIVEALDALNGAMPDLRELRRLNSAFSVLGQNVPPVSPEQVATRIEHLDRLIVARRDRIGRELRRVMCPPGFATSPMTVAQRCGIPADGPLQSGSEVIERAFDLYDHLLGRLTRLALRAEKAFTGAA